MQDRGCVRVEEGSEGRSKSGISVKWLKEREMMVT